MKRITSASNAAVKRARRLLSRKGRDTDDAFLIEGFILIEEAARSGIEIEQVFLRGADEDGSAVLSLEGIVGFHPQGSAGQPGDGLARGVRVTSLPEGVFDSIADTVTPKGMIAVARKPHHSAESGASDMDAGPGRAGAGALLVLDRIQDPGNVGALIRTAGAIGFDGALCVKGTADPFSPKAVRAAAGALFRLPVCERGGPEEALAHLRSEGYRIAVLDMRGSSLCWEADLTGRTAFVVGNEGGGVSTCFRDSADVTVRAPMTGGAESLGAVVAAGIVIYERYRQCVTGEYDG